MSEKRRAAYCPYCGTSDEARFFIEKETGLDIVLCAACSQSARIENVTGRVEIKATVKPT